MDYCTLERVKQAMHITSGSSVDDALLSLLVTAASRTWDRLCTGVPDGTDYFKTEDVVDERLTGQIDYIGGTIICYPHKPIINSVASISYQNRIIDEVHAVSGSRVDCYGGRVTAYPHAAPTSFPRACRVAISYNGGLGATTADLPADMQEAVAILAIRFYREAESGVGDAIGVAELTQLVYTKAIPVRVANVAEVYKRRVGWRNVA